MLSFLLLLYERLPNLNIFIISTKGCGGKTNAIIGICTTDNFQKTTEILFSHF